MKKLIALLALVASAAFGQLTTPSTTLSASIPAPTPGVGVTQWCVASATSISVNSATASGTYLFVDKEAAQVVSAGSSTTCFNVRRGQLGTAPAGHINGATVWIGNVATGSGDASRPFAGGVLTATVPNGSCTASAQYSLPVIIYGPPNFPFAGELARCIAGVWQTGRGQTVARQPFTAFTTLSPPNPIATASVTDVAGTIWFSQLNIPYNATLTGACVLNGATVGTDKWIVALYDQAGNLLANSALAGTTTATASKYQCIAFTATVSVTGPSGYYVALQGNGTTDNFQAYAANSAPTNYGTQSQTGTFGTLPAMTTPTVTFTASKGPLMMVY
jgi:hypothetical protein